jgi:hypothetical protein
MAAAGADARKALDGLRRTLGVSASAPLDAAAAALDRFMTVDAEIVKLSRQNTNVRSLSLALGRKRTVTGACDDELRALEEALSKHEFRATR